MIIETTTGLVRGTATTAGATTAASTATTKGTTTAAGRATTAGAAFRGIPYARQRRFAPPEPFPAWTGVRDAVEPGPAATQPRSRLEHVIGPMTLPQSEDCLSLNVFTPPDREGTGRPVLVWIHGGGFSSGSGGEAWYDGSRLAAEADAVVVTLNYRLGALGFLALDGVAPPNLGIADQLAALHWVRDNIAAFGGDPARVTLSGQSAGAQSTLALWSAPRAKGLISRVALMSTPIGMRPYSPDEAAQWSAEYLDVLGVAAKDKHRLATMPARELIDGQVALAMRHRAPWAIAPPLQLVADGDLVAPDLIAAVEPGPALLSWTRDDARPFGLDAPQAEVDEHTAAFFTTGLPELAKRFGPDSALFRFDWAAPGNPLGACHCIDIPFLFGTHTAGKNAAGKNAKMLDGAPDGLEADNGLRRAWISLLHGERPQLDSPLITVF